MDKKIIFRRKKERQFIRGMLTCQVFIVICLLLGVGFALKNMQIQYDRTSELHTIMQADVVRATQDIKDLLENKRKGHRFTAGNAWQMTQLILAGEVDMADFPDYDLIYPDATWFNGWLAAHGFLTDS